jgi:hypothetical protein
MPDTFPQSKPVKIAADKHQPAVAYFIEPPRPVEIRVHGHMHALEHEAAVRSRQVDDPFGPQQILALLDHELLQPRKEAAAFQWLPDAQRHAIYAMTMAPTANGYMAKGPLIEGRLICIPGRVRKMETFEIERTPIK